MIYLSTEHVALRSNPAAVPPIGRSSGIAKARASAFMFRIMGCIKLNQTRDFPRILYFWYCDAIQQGARSA
jgi:hypothetical protein